MFSDIYKKLVGINKPKVAVAIDGYMGSGKTFIANKLADSHAEIILVHSDDFLVTEEQRKKNIKKYGPELAMSIHGCRFSEIKKLVEDFKNGKNNFEFYGFNHDTGECDKKINCNFVNKKVLIVEGVFLIHPKTIADIWEYSIYIKGNIDEIDKKRVEREKVRWGDKYFPEARSDSYMGMAIRSYKKFIEEFKPENLIDLVIDNKY